MWLCVEVAVESDPDVLVLVCYSRRAWFWYWLVVVVATTDWLVVCDRWHKSVDRSQNTQMAWRWFCLLIKYGARGVCAELASEATGVALSPQNEFRHSKYTFSSSAGTLAVTLCERSCCALPGHRFASVQIDFRSPVAAKYRISPPGPVFETSRSKRARERRNVDKGAAREFVSRASPETRKLTGRV